MCGQLCLTLRYHGLQPSRVFCPWDFPKEYWNEFPFPPPGDLPNKGIKPTSLVSPALAGGTLTTGPPGCPQIFRGFLFPELIYQDSTSTSTVSP